MGLALASLGRHDEAAQKLERAAELQPMNPHACYNLGMAYHPRGNEKKVREMIDRLDDFDPKMRDRLIKDTKKAYCCSSW
jgi:Flp pilus assembly protein TadD